MFLCSLCDGEEKIIEEWVSQRNFKVTILNSLIIIIASYTYVTAIYMLAQSIHTLQIIVINYYTSSLVQVPLHIRCSPTCLLHLLSLYHQMLEVCQIIYYGSEYIYQLQNYVEFFVYILSITFVFMFFNDCGCPKEWQWQIGLLAMLMAWTNVIFFAFKFPAIGIFVLIFYKIVKTFLKVALFSLVLILGFSFILLMMFNNPDSQVTTILLNNFSVWVFMISEVS